VDLLFDLFITRGLVVIRSSVLHVGLLLDLGYYT